MIHHTKVDEGDAVDRQHACLIRTVFSCMRLTAVGLFRITQFSIESPDKYQISR